MALRYTRYYELENPTKDCTHMKMEVYYRLGGTSMTTHRPYPRGYYFSVTPVVREDCGSGVTMEIFTAFTGMSMVEHECKRYSRKQYQIAREFLEHQGERYMNAWFPDIKVKGNPIGIEREVTPV